jgi:DnaK suppressor protein
VLRARLNLLLCISMDTQHYTQRLKDEQAQLRAELEKIGTEVNAEEGIWEPVASKLDVDPADSNEMADAAEDSDDNVAMVAELGVRYQNIVHALKRLEEGTYGMCEISGEPIEEDRLNANPAARTCKAHMEEEGALE